jgi:hypothetical protein
MKLFSVIIFRQTGDRPVTLCKVMDLSSIGFFQRGAASEVILFASREVVKRTAIGTLLGLGLYAVQNAINSVIIYI